MVAVFCATCTAEEAGALMRRVIDHLVSKEGMAFEDPDDETVFEQQQPGPVEWSKRPVFLSGHSESYALMVDHYWKPDASYHSLVLTLDSYIRQEELFEEWRRLVDQSAKVVNLVRSHFAFAWAQAVDDERDPVQLESLRPDVTPKVFLPWNVLGKTAITGIADRLQALPTYKTDMLEAGELLQPVEVPGRHPAKEFIDGINSIGATYLDLLVR
jgi:hypothetical protein